MSSSARTSVLLFAAFHGLYALTSAGNPFRVPDEFEVYFQVERLVDAGDLSVPQALAVRQPVIVDGRIVGTEPVFFGRIGVDGKPYAPYGPLVAFLAVPHHLAGRALAHASGVPREPDPSWPTLVGGVTTLSSATAAALAVAAFHAAAAALGTPPAWAAILSLLLGGTTVLWPYATTLYSEAWQAAALTGAAALLLQARRGARGARARAGAAALCVGGAGLIKVTGLVFAPAFIVAVLADRSTPPRARWAAAGALGAGIALAVGVHLWWNHLRFGSPFEVGYDWSETIPRPPARLFDLADLPRGLAVMLLAPGKALPLWAPVLLLAATRAVRCWRRDRAVAVAAGWSLAAGLLVFGAYLFPEGGYSHGPRHLVPIVPLLLLPAAGPEAGGWPRVAVATCAVLGGTMAALAVSVSFLEDQAIGRPPSVRVSPYYRLVEPPPGRPSNRYNLGYLPFVTALRSPGWMQGGGGVGQGPDFFPLHLQHARRQFPGGAAIPAWLPWAWSVGWLVLLAVATWRLARRVTSEWDAGARGARRCGWP